MKKSQKLKSKQIKELNNIIRSNQSSNKEVRRTQTIILIDKEKDIEEISAITGFGRSRIFELRNNYLKKGLEVIKDKRKKNPKELLTRNQREEIIQALKTKIPKIYGYESNYWTTSILGNLIEKSYNIKYKSKTSYYLLFRQAKFTLHKPGRIYHKRDEAEVRVWRKQAKRRIKQAWQEKDTVILTEDEMILSTQTTIQKIWLPQGDYPKIEISNQRENRSIYGFLNIKTGQEHTFKTEKQNMHITSNILKRIRRAYAKQKILIIWDQAGGHRGSVAQDFIKQDKNIETIYFPRYAPEENPQEYVWKNGRSNITHNHFIQDIDQTANDFVNYLNATKFDYPLLGFKSSYGV